MTCIVGLVHENTVYIGADSMALAGWERQETNLRKIFSVGQFLIGYTSSFRMGQILQYHLEVRQQQDGETDERYMVVAFIEAVRDCLKAKGYAHVESNKETGGFFLVGYKGAIYHIADDFQVNHYASGIAAVGAGREYALGALLATERIKDPEKRILTALEVSARLSSAVMGPFHIKSQMS